jgi:hypothetical protein
LTSLFGTNVGSRDFWGNSLAGKSSYNIGAYQLTTGARPLITEIGEENSQLTGPTLKAFPNPFSSNATVSFTSKTGGKATVLLYDVDGKLISTLFAGQMKAGESKQLGLKSDAFANGVYILRLLSDEKVLTQKVLVNK